MSFLFSRTKQKSPAELVRSLSDVLGRVESAEQRRQKGSDDASRLLLQIRQVLYGDQENDPVPDQIAALAQEVYATDVLVGLAANLHALEFDARKDVVVVFTTLLRRQIGTRSPTVDYLATKPQIMDSLITWSASPDLALTAGAIVRDCVRYEPLARLVLNSPLFWNYFEYVTTGPFEVATDSFATLHDLFSDHGPTVSEFLTRNAGPFTLKMAGLMGSENYVTKRQSVKLMAHIIRQRSNYAFMTEYINDAGNLKQVMNLLRDRSKNIQYEAFHIFKVFVANPKKGRPVADILVKNKQKLLTFLSDFHSDRKDDDSFKDEKAFLIKQISALPQPHSGTQPLPPQPPPQQQVGGPSILTPATTAPPPVVHAEPVHRSGDYFQAGHHYSNNRKQSHPLPSTP
ncbi:hypothetical protein TRICI_005963 [Trichomonascus ciferrii]|uniref:Mo25-like protein n=1 Tax=Trichomonascus ciferrii TaxID=44093 RepID=A0A642UU80_9ASCO|nr:hypothetical protein TRICI_005963 [Trichomonascus ciferrii]